MDEENKESNMKVSEREREREEPWSIHHGSIAKNEETKTRGMKA